MPLPSKKAYKQLQSSDNSEESTPAGDGDAVAGIDQAKLGPNSSSSSEDESKLEDKLKEFAAKQALHTSTAWERSKKTVMIEIKGKAPPGKDGVFALNQDAKCQDYHLQQSLNEEHTSKVALETPKRDKFQCARERTLALESQGNLMHERKVEYFGSACIVPTMTHPSMLYKERLIDTRKLLPGAMQAKSALDRVKRLQNRAGMMDVEERIQERRVRCSALQSRSYNMQRFKGGLTSSESLYKDALGEKPILDMDSKYKGVLKISDRSFCENGCDTLLHAIKNSDKLVELDLSGCNIYKGDDLAQIVRSATCLKRLSLEWNSLGLARTGISALSSAIASNCSLKEVSYLATLKSFKSHVDLRSNRIGPSIAAALAHALQSNYSLTCLDLRWNEIGPGGAAAIVAMLQQNHSLTDVRLVGNGVPPSIQAQIDELLDKNRTCKLLQRAGPPLDDHMYLESDIGLNSRTISKEMSDINLERISSLQKEIDNLRQEMEAWRRELYETQLQKVATDTQLQTTQIELKEEILLRKFIEKEIGDFKSQINLSKQQVHDMKDQMTRNEQMAVMKLGALNSEVMEAREKRHHAQVAEAEARRENKLFKDQMARIQIESKACVEATQERAKSDIDYKISVIKRLEAEIAQRDLKHKEEVESLRAKFTTQIKNLEVAKDNAIRESERQKSVAMQCETQLTTKELCFQNEKEAAQKVFDGKINMVKAELAALKNQLEANNHDQRKVKKKNASIVEDYENQIFHLTSSITKLDVAKSGMEEEMSLMAAEQNKLQERIKVGDSKLREMESKLEADRVKHAHALAHEAAKHLEDRKSLENEVSTTRRQIEVVHLHVKEIQSEQERRKFDTERRVTGAETAVLEWIHQQFASLKSALIVQHSVAGVG